MCRYDVIFRKDEEVNEMDFSDVEVDMKSVINFIEALKGFRINEELVFNTVDYHRMDSIIEFLKKKENTDNDN